MITRINNRIVHNVEGTPVNRCKPFIGVSGSKPAHGTGEWAASNVNIQNGCEHDCAYCYAKAMAVRFHRTTPKGWTKPKLKPGNVNKRYTYRTGRIMFPSSHDITPANINECVTVLKGMLEAGNSVLIVSKPHLSCVRRLCRELLPYREKVLFRFTIGSANNRVLKYWEPGAPSFSQRVKALKLAHAQGFATSVSCEPMLDGNVAAVIAAVRPYVSDAIWVGKANSLRQILSLNSPGDAQMQGRASALAALQNDNAIRDLHRQFKADPLIKWKDSIKRVVGIKRPTIKGMDV